MIPIKLAMRNFMCFRENVPPLYFDSIHTACISGNNGNGKSAIIDAMTWALWGQSRAASDDELIHAGQTEVEVEFEFTVSGQRYRIIRKHSKPRQSGRSGQTILELQAATGDGFKPITGDTIIQTQQKLLQLLRMDYDTFINSAFLRQGHADEFTKKRPGERKQVLTNILQLVVYDELEEKARELAKTQENEKAQLESAINDIDTELARKSSYEVELEMAQSQLAQAEKLTGEQEAKLTALRLEKEALEKARAQLAELEARLKDMERNRSLWEEQVRRHVTRTKEYEQAITQSASIESGYEQLREVKKLCQELDKKQKLVNALNERQHRLEMAIYKAGQALITEHALSQNAIRELEKVTEQLPELQKELEQVQSQQVHLAEAESQLQAKKQSSQELRARVHYLEAEKDRLKHEIDEIKEKLELLSAGVSDKCPLCESELGPEGKQRIDAKYLAERDGKSASLKSKLSEKAQKETVLKSLEAEIAQLEARLSHDRAAAQARIAVLGKSIAEAGEARNRLADERKRLTEIEERLAGKQFAIAEQEAQAQLESEIAKLDFDQQKHEQARQQLSNLEQYESRKMKLDEAYRLISQEKEAAEKAQATVRELLGSFQTDNMKKAELTFLLKTYPKLMNDLAQAEAGYQTTLLHQKQAQETLGGVKAKLERCRELETRKTEKKTQLSQAENQEKVYKELAQAFGKKGVQAMLIEIAIPDIENEANKLLARMTDNRMHVKIETQRATKKGDVLETLDINISDELGTRNYEMFSGGEAFRIDFAIRIALSKLLARRAGAPLPTLIIDEGFGTQDSTGIEKLKEAINSIQDDFEKILVITHIAELRDAFPTRIEVVKTDGGSTLFLN